MTRLLAAACVLAVVSACGGGGSPEGEPTVAAHVGTSAAASPSPCSLLAAEDVSAVLGPLAGPPYRAFGVEPNAGGDVCRYEGADLRSVVVGVSRESGAEEISALNTVSTIVADGGLGELRLIDGSTLTGEWDEARVVGCCELNALRGDQLVKIDYTGARLDPTAAAALANAAIRRLDQPLSVDDAANAAAALAREAAKPRIRSVCKLLTRADAEAVAQTHLAAEPTGDESSCTYSVKLGATDSTFDVTLHVKWRDGFREMATIANVVDRTISLIGLPGGDNATTEGSGTWDEFSRNIIGVSAVKRDVMVSVESGPFQQDLVQAFVTKAIENVDN